MISDKKFSTCCLIGISVFFLCFLCAIWYQRTSPIMKEEENMLYNNRNGPRSQHYYVKQRGYSLSQCFFFSVIMGILVFFLLLLTARKNPSSHPTTHVIYSDNTCNHSSRSTILEDQEDMIGSKNKSSSKQRNNNIYQPL